MNRKNNQHFASTHEKIRQALLELLDHKTLQKISVREICELAQIHPSTFYAHYPSVWDLMSEIEMLLWQEHTKLMEAKRIEQGDFLEPEALTLFCSYIFEHRHFYQAYLPQTASVDFLERWMHTMVETQKEYGVWKAEDMERFEWDCRFFFGGAMQIVRHWLQTDCRVPPQQLADILSELRPDSLCLDT